MEPPICECHGEPMRWAKCPRYRSGGYWRCRIKLQAYARDWWWRQNGLFVARHNLRTRRSKALERMAARHARAA